MPPQTSCFSSSSSGFRARPCDIRSTTLGMNMPARTRFDRLLLFMCPRVSASFSCSSQRLWWNDKKIVPFDECRYIRFSECTDVACGNTEGLRHQPGLRRPRLPPPTQICVSFLRELVDVFFFYCFFFIRSYAELNLDKTVTSHQSHSLTVAACMQDVSLYAAAHETCHCHS